MKNSYDYESRIHALKLAFALGLISSDYFSKKACEIYNESFDAENVKLEYNANDAQSYKKERNKILVQYACKQITEDECSKKLELLNDLFPKDDTEPKTSAEASANIRLFNKKIKIILGED